jgi:flagellar basal body-associated protein FliL
MEDKKVKSKKLILIILMIVSFVLLAIGVFLISIHSDGAKLSQTSRLMFITFMLGFGGGGFYTLGLFLLPKSKSKKESIKGGGSIEQTTNPKGS